MEKFEYKILNISRQHLKREKFQEELIGRLNDLGELGWEVITIEGLTEASLLMQAGHTGEILFILKRKKVF
ncbi:MAG: DUF4177 domain-containing protein [Cytophagaceae bacterium]|nr:DUF4177 domain-containing protein [Cytophagaceae bacterium]MBK9511331.1 DUF4177 domain-containing protein [Cytophagaceae bacterium]MBK9932729.1 DUF4177 domain-containing protein [Cytophagaceae bacterium]MBL0303580.1 DUF4177 domain-containing protein [Cytophagaceae bacterium]MBL0326409.1 DUF4177 domain-containing protein [Cytophagaceae bacterium]